MCRIRQGMCVHSNYAGYDEVTSVFFEPKSNREYEALSFILLLWSLQLILISE